MTPIETMSRLRAGKMAPREAWEAATQHLHEHIDWSAVLACALKAQPDLHPFLSGALATAVPGDNKSIKSVFTRIHAWAQTQDSLALAPVLAVWAAQNLPEECTLAELVQGTSIAWKWVVAVALLPVDRVLERADHHVFVHVLAMDQWRHDHAFDKTIDPVTLSTLLTP